MRFMPRSTCAIAVVIESSATSRPRISATSPASSLVPSPVDGGGESVLLAGARRHALHGLGHHLRRPLLVEVGGQPGERQQERHHREARLQRERPAVGEAVAVAEPDERGPQQAPQPVVTRERPRVLGVQLVPVALDGDGDLAGGGHRASVPAGSGVGRQSFGSSRGATSSSFSERPSTNQSSSARVVVM